VNVYSAELKRKVRLLADFPVPEINSDVSVKNKMFVDNTSTCFDNLFFSCSSTDLAHSSSAITKSAVAGRQYQQLLYRSQVSCVCSCKMDHRIEIIARLFETAPSVTHPPWGGSTFKALTPAWGIFALSMISH